MNMKRIIFILLFFCCVKISLGQLRYGGEIAEGICGYMPSDVTGGIKNEFKLGVFLRYPLKRKLFVESGIYCGRARANIEHFLFGIENLKAMKAEWTYFDVPLLIGHSFYFNKIKTVSLSGCAGFYVSWESDGDAILTLYDEYYDNIEVEIGNLFREKQIEINSVIYSLEPKNRFNIGARLGVDCIYKKWIIKIITSLGYIKYNSNFIKGVRPYSMMIGIGYFLR